MSERKQSKLSALYKYRNKLKDKLHHINSSLREANQVKSKVEGKLKGVEEEIQFMENRKILITTHFIERYNERVREGATEEDIEKHILTPAFVKMIKTLGNGSYPSPCNDYTIIVEDGKLITILTVTT